MKFSLYALPVGFGEALKIHMVAGEVFEACQVEGCGAVVVGGGAELGEVVGDLLHDGFLSGVWMVLSCDCRDDGVEVDRVDHVVEVFGLVLGEWLPVAWPIHCTVEGYGPVGPDKPDGFLDFGTVQAADDRRVGVAYVTSCQVCGVEWVDFCLPIECCEGWCDECAIHGCAPFGGVGVVVVSRVCGLRSTVKAALKPRERFMEGVSGVTDVTEAFIASLGA